MPQNTEIDRRVLELELELELEPSFVKLRISLTKEEVAALQEAFAYVRTHMAHEHSWMVRDAAMMAIGKVITAAHDVNTAHGTSDYNNYTTRCA